VRDLRKKKQISRLAATCAVVLCALCFAANTVLGQETREEKGQEPAQGEIKLEGKYIKQLILEGEDSNKVTFDQPGESIKVAVGKYRLREVCLDGGYFYPRVIVSDANWIEVGEDKPAVLKVGAPLKQIVTAERQGRALELDYKLLGIGGEKYVNSDSNKPPTFTVYKGGKRIASGEFEYGGGSTCSYPWRVPLTAFGKLKIVPSQDVDKLCLKEGDAIFYDWKWYYGASALALWAVLVLAIVLVKANRNPQALFVLVPLAVEIAVWSVVKKIIPSPYLSTGTQAVYSLLVGVTILWLLSHWLGNRNRFVAFLLALVIMAVAGVAGAISYNEYSGETLSSTIGCAILALMMLFAFVLTGWWCRKRFSGLRFILWLGVWNVVVFLGTSIVVLIGTGILRGIPEWWSELWFVMTSIVLIEALIFGGCAYAIVLPFMILALRSSFYRQRFYACLRLKSMPTATEAGVPQL
jgi:hypothetical protein